MEGTGAAEQALDAPKPSLPSAPAGELDLKSSSRGDRERIPNLISRLIRSKIGVEYTRGRFYFPEEKGVKWALAGDTLRHQMGIISRTMENQLQASLFIDTILRVVPGKAVPHICP